MSKDFFNRKPAKEIALPEHDDYDPSNVENDLLACGITDVESFQQRHHELFKSLIVDTSQENPVATVARKVEDTFTKREIAFLLSKDMLITAYNQSVDESKKNK